MYRLLLMLTIALTLLRVGGPSLLRASNESLSPAAAVGKEIFFDRSLSASGKMSCATCHDPSHAYGPPNALAVELGGPALSDAGTRAVPSLRYQEYTPPYSDLLDNPDGIGTPGPGGGLTQDGRAPTLADQAQIPLLAANEMANRNPADVVNKIKTSAYAAAFQKAFGDSVFKNTNAAFKKALEALQAFQLEDPSFHPSSSKYDLYASNKIGGTLTSAERRGFAVYNDPKKGNCFACYYNGAGLNGSVRLFTDYTYPTVNGVVQKFDDLPVQYRSNIDTQLPLDGKPRGSKPSMSDQDVEDLETFLGTLTDADVMKLNSSFPEPSGRVASLSVGTFIRF